jgi:hypothetical protein
MQRHRHQEFICILSAIEAELSKDKIADVIVDNYVAHGTLEARALAISASTMDLPLRPDIPFAA